MPETNQIHMKTIIATMILAIAATAMSTTAIQWEELSLDLGKVTMGEKVTLSYTFENTGTSSVTILEAKGSCGCTDVTYTKDAIEPGGKAQVQATFLSKKTGAFSKTVSVRVSGMDEPTTLSFKGEVVE